MRSATPGAFASCCADRLLGGGVDVASPDLSLLDEVVPRAGRSGLNVTCRFEGDRDHVPRPVAHLAFRVVQESLTNALRYAPGADVRIEIRVDESQRGLDVRVENDRAARLEAPLAGTGHGLVGLRERIQTLGGHFSAGRTGVGGGGRSRRACRDGESGFGCRGHLGGGSRLLPDGEGALAVGGRGLGGSGRSPTRCPGLGAIDAAGDDGSSRHKMFSIRCLWCRISAGQRPELSEVAG
jgi:hypothetical protein